MQNHRDLRRFTAAYPYRVLIVDDEAPHRMLEREILESPKYEVIEARTGEEAIEILRVQTFDVVLMDKRMPGMGGDEACREIREVLNDVMTPVIMVTGTGSSEDLVTSMQCGANDFIRKPYNPLELTARVDAAVNHKRLTDQMENAEGILFALARMVEAKDENTGDHCSRLAHYALVFGGMLGLSSDELLALRRGGVLHDIGKLGIPESILCKPGKLDESEWEVMKQHTVIGERLCAQLKSMSLTVKIIRSHHERWDGSGYPDGLKGEEIPLVARIFQIIDIYDALSYARPYKPAFTQAEVVRILEEETARGWRDPVLMARFLELLRDMPEVLALPAVPREDLGMSIFDSIARTGALDWEAGKA